MNNFEYAKNTLVYYIRKVWENSGLKWDYDNEVEVTGIIDTLVDGIKKDILNEIANTREISVSHDTKNAQYVDILVKYKNDDSLYEFRTNIANFQVPDKNIDYVCLEESGQIIYTCDKGMILPVSDVVII